MAGGVRIGAHFNKNAYMHEQTTIRFGLRISGRKHINRCTPFLTIFYMPLLSIDVILNF